LKKRATVKKRLKPTKRRSAKQLSWIEDATGKSRVDWVGEIQKIIGKISKPTKDKWHDTNDPVEMVKLLAMMVRKTWSKKERFDGNMRIAATIGYILCTWYLRVHLAKSHDPRRPVRHRQAAYFQRQHFAMALINSVIDESDDTKMFPDQNWESPFSLHPTDGYFI